jgi:DNA-binding MarR family transcriptional regulator
MDFSNMKTEQEQPTEMNFTEGSMPDIFKRVEEISKNLAKFQRMVLGKTQFTPPQYCVINELSKSEKEGLSLSELAQRCYSSKPTMTYLIDTLEEKHVVKRVRHSTDRRKILVELTPEGKKLRKEAPSVNHVYADCCSILSSEETDILTLLLEKINTALKGYIR